MTPLVILIAVILCLLYAYWRYYEFKKWAFFPSLLIVVGSTTIFFLLAVDYPVEEACKPIHIGHDHNSTLHCIISDIYEDLSYILREGHGVEIVIFCLVFSIISLCDQIKERNIGRDKENDS
ncbi:hypothetical protein [Bartonella sp. AP18SXNS]